MFEIFFFINPIGIYCYDIEKKVQQTTAALDIDVCCHYIPVVTFATIQNDVIRRRQENQTLNSVSCYSIAIQRALQDYHALKIAYGNKKARNFLFILQQKLDHDENIFSNHLSRQIIKKMGLNFETVQKLRDSDYIKDSIQQDQKLIKQWHIKVTPTIIIFNENQVNNSGVLLEGTISQDDLLNIFWPHRAKDKKPELANLFSNNYLRLI